MISLLNKNIELISLRYLDQIERAVSNGDCVLIENIGESLDPVLDPILGRNTIKKGRFVLLFLLKFETCHFNQCFYQARLFP